MRRLKYPIMVLFVLFAAGAFFLKCGSGGSSGPSSATVTMSGSIDFAGGTEIDYENIAVGFGGNESAVDSSGDFSIKGTKDVPGLMIALDETDSVPIFMAVVPDPDNSVDVSLDAQSTAMALVFLNPFVCVSDPEDAQAVIDTILHLPEFSTFRNMLEDSLSANPKYLMTDDQDLIDAMAAVVAAYVAAAPDIISRNYPMSSGLIPNYAKISGSGIVVEAQTSLSGHLMRHVSGNTFEVENSYGRWAYLVLPDGTKKLLPPNGQLFDFIKDGVPWAPSKTQFTLEAKEAPEFKYVHIYGYGWNDETNNLWDDLTAEEKNYCHTAGMATIAVEFTGHVLSFYGNVKSGLTDAGVLRKFDDAKIIELASFLTGDGLLMVQVVDMVKQHQWWDLIYAVANTAVKKFASDGEYRDFWMKLAGYTMSEATISRISKVIITKPVGAAAYGLMIGENMTSAAKTVLGLTSSRFKTSFKIWKEVGDFGNISGGVFDKESGKPIEGVTVVLEGDDNNPINTPHSYSTDADGGFYFENILIGAKTLQITKTGYQSASVSVTVVKDKTITKNVELDKEHGYANGRILNEIFVENSLSNTLFNKEINLRAAEIGGEERTESYSITNGTYHLSLFPGEWWIVAEHDDYKNDSVRVAIEDDSETQASDITMVPDMKMEGTFELDLNGDGVYEINYQMVFDIIAASERVSADSFVSCPTGYSSDVIRMIGGIVPDNEFQIWLSPDDLSPSSASEQMGTLAQTICRNGGAAGTVAYATNDYYCTEDDGDYGTLIFTALGGPYLGEECYCGITDYGSVNFYKYEGDEIGDVISGFVLCYYPAWTSCDCDHVDTDGDDIDDSWEVECGKGRFTVDFKIFVGTSYKIPRPSNAPVAESYGGYNFLDQVIRIIK